MIGSGWQLAILLVGASPPTLATAGDNAILSEEVAKSDGAGFEALLSELVAAAEAERRGLHRTEEVRTVMDGVLRTFARRQFEDAEFAMEVSEAELEEAYRRSRDSALMGLIQTRTEDDARVARDKLSNGEAFTSVAEAHDIMRNTEIRTVTRAMVPPELVDAVFAMPLKQVSDVMKTTMGYAVILVTERSPANMANFPKERERVREQLVAGRREAMLKHFTGKKRASANVELDEAFVESTGNGLEIASDGARVLARVGDRGVSYEEVVAEMRSLFGNRQSSHFSGPRVKLEVLGALVNRIILADEAMAKGYDRNPTVRARFASARRRILKDALQRSIETASGQPSEQEVDAYYSKHVNQFRPDKSYSIRHVLVPDRATAKRVLDELRGGVSLYDLADRYTTDATSRPRGGLLDTIGDTKLREIDEALHKAVLALEIGEVSNVVRSRFGYHVVRLERRHWPPAPPLRHIRALVARAAQRAEVEAVYASAVAGARASVRITINNAEAKRAGVSAPSWVKKAP